MAATSSKEEFFHIISASSLAILISKTTGVLVEFNAKAQMRGNNDPSHEHLSSRINSNLRSNELGAKVGASRMFHKRAFHPLSVDVLFE